MTRKINLLIAFLLAVTLALAAGGVAEAKNVDAQFYVGYDFYSYTTYLSPDYKIVNSKMDVKTFTENGRAYVPVRYLAYGLGVAEKDVNWDEASQTVTLSMEGTTVKLQVGSKTLYINGNPQEMDVTPLMRDDRVFLPARFVAEAFGYEVYYWDNTVSIELKR
ncbi:copper amine oxidase N-terminal domain-containing protein [Neomoorella mulderi]|uniref:Primary amine oxidase n=1 Tax=Moorella mulderi DSM 14980 TaxID=1122241 RepID=A0A151AS61_9FIRM|nr:copper amine oxidase N-terminal domain-containing protein [Moorella mulderi]KYH30491.1 primary amine oxidase precursor [Moorella mulderi DSM 14980]